MKIALIFFIVLIIIVFALISIMMSKSFKRAVPEEFRYRYYYDYYKELYPRKEVTFFSGKAKLHAFLYGETNQKALLVLAHGSGGFHEDYMTDIVWFVNHGYRVFAMDFTGSGASGETGIMGLPQSVADMDAVLHYIKRDPELSQMKKVLYGHSWGAYGVTAVLNFKHNVEAVASMAAYDNPTSQMVYVFHLIMGKLGGLTYPFVWLWHQLRFGKYGNLSAVNGINRAGIPVILVHGNGDRVVPYDATSLFTKKNKITNSRVEYYPFFKEGQNDHDSFFHTEQACRVLSRLEKEKIVLNQECQGHAPKDKTAALYAKLDLDLLNEPNEEFYIRINQFFELVL